MSWLIAGLFVSDIETGVSASTILEKNRKNMKYAKKSPSAMITDVKTIVWVFAGVKFIFCTYNGV
jgi:hypothetical protein